MELMFAYDTDLFLSHKSIDKMFDTMNVELANVLTWFNSNKLYLNVNKTNWLLFHPLAVTSTDFSLTFLLKIYISKGNM